MRVSRHSWHYRLWRVEQMKAHPTSLCPYFWAVVARLVVCLLGAAIPIALVVLYVVAWINHPAETAVDTAVIAGGGVSLVAAIALSEWSDRRRQRRLYGPTVIREPNVFTSFVKAKKERVCPRIELVD